MIYKKSKIKDKGRVISLLNLFLNINLEKRQDFNFSIYILTAGLVFLTVSLIFIELKLVLLALFLTLIAALFILIGIIVDIKIGRDSKKEYRIAREEMEKILGRYEIDEESKALIKIIFDQKSKDKKK